MNRPPHPWRALALAAGAVSAMLAADAASGASPAHAQRSATPAGPHARTPSVPYEMRFAAIGDYGLDTPEEAAVASLVAAWQPDFVITLGDNNYPDGEAATIDANIGRHYHAFISPYLGTYGAGADQNRFFPSLGNHDWHAPGAQPYLDWFTLPGNERYYSFRRGPVELFALDSDPQEPDGIAAGSTQGQWLEGALARSTAPFRFVYFHHPPYSSGPHGATVEMQWPFREWGADAVLAGHDHAYERIVRDGFPSFVNGLGGAPLYDLGAPVAGSAVRFAEDHGAMLVEVTDELATFRAITRAGIVADVFSLPPGGVTFGEVELVSAGAVWKYRDDGSDQGTAWRAPGFDDSSWASGSAELGYGDGDEATVVSYGPDPDNKHVTTWFRRSFPVADPASLGALRLELLQDDGAVVYLNGTEIARSNLPAGTIGHTTLASAAVSDGLERAFLGFEVPLALLVAGANVLAVELHQSSVTSSDTSFDLRLVGGTGGTMLSARGAAWRYEDGGVFPGPAWTEPSFDDSSWASGAAELGYGDGDEATVVSYGPNAANKHITTWFRRSFAVRGAAEHAGLLLRLVYDDGAIVYLNGTEVLRTNLPFAGTSPSTTAAFARAGADESAWLETLIDRRLLQDGLNVIAVEIHQQSPSSSDISFDLELVGY